MRRAFSFGFFIFMRKFIFIVSIAYTTVSAQLTHDVKVVHEDARSLTLEFRPAFSIQSVKSTDGQSLKRISFSGEIADPGKPGDPWIAYKAISLQFPSSRVSVTILSSESRIEDGMKPLPIPKMIHDKKFGSSPAYQAGSVRRIPVHALAEVAEVAPSLGKFVGTLKLYPVEFDENANSAKVYTKLVLRIEFDQWNVTSNKASEPSVGNDQTNEARNTPRLRKKSAGDSPLAQGTWYKMQVLQTGIYRIDQAFLQKANIALASIGNINSIRIFGNGGRMLPEDVSQSRPNGLEEVARYVVDNNANGLFDAGDYVLFYGVSTRGWDYDSATKRYTHRFSYYSDPNFYFLTFGGAAGLAMDSIASTDVAGAFTPTDFQEKIFFKQERSNLIASGRQWVGQKFGSNGIYSAVYTNSLPGYIASSLVQYRFVFRSRASTYDAFTVYESGQQLGSLIQTYPVDVTPGQNETNFAYITPEVSFTGSGMISDNRSNVKIVFNTDNQSADGWIDYMDLLYRRSFDAGGTSLFFDSPDTTAIIEYVVNNLPVSGVYVFDVTDHQSVKRITQVRTDIADGTVRRFQLAQSAGNIKSIAVVGLAGTLTPASIAQIPNSNLRGLSPGAEYVIVSPTAFAEQAERYRAYRQAHDSLQSTVAIIDNVENEFSGGLLDPMAVRDFLRYAETNWTVKPRYVLLFGEGHYDYKNILSTTPNWIPPYESLESNYQIHSFASDDFFVMLDAGSPRISIAIGRIPARSIEEAKSMVDKIIQYETNSPLDTWRNRITFVGDDGLTSERNDGNIHTAQAEDLAQNHTPDSFEKNKIYESMYPTVLSATGRTKPQVNKDIVSAINRGTLILNFSGHGNTQQWAHEAVFTQAADIPQLVNRDRLTFLVAATCNFAAYDDPSEESGGEQILVMDKGGAVGEVTSSRAVYQYNNQQFNNQLYDNLFARDANGNPRRLGDVMWLTKQIFPATVNDDWNAAKYHLLGDPTLRLNVPRSLVTLDSVNGASTAQVDTMKALGIVSVNGLIRNPDNSPWPTFNGTGTIEVFDSQRQVFLQDINYTVEVTGSVLYRGEVSVTNGAYRVLFPIPKDVTYGNRSRLSFYSWNNQTDAVGFTENVTINGTDSTVVADTSGPQMSIYFDDQSFRPGDRVKPNTMLYVKLQSREGINTSTVGIGHGLQAVLNNTTDIDLTNYYRGDLNTYQSGLVQYQMAGLADGKYNIVVKAWDIRNNSSQAQTSFVISSNSDLEIVNVVNYPNPFSRSTMFTFQRNSEDPIDIEIKIYTITGRLIQHLDSYAVIDRFVQIPWDGRDHDGDPLANGVYLYKVTAKTENRGTTKEELGKLVIMR